MPPLPQFKDAPALIASAKPGDMPESYRFRVADQAAAGKAGQALKRLRGVGTVVA